MRFFSNLFDIIRRNPFTTVLVVMLIIAAPQFFGLIALLMIVPILILAIGTAVMLHRLRNVQKNMHEPNSGGTQANPGGAKPEGKVTVHIPRQEPKVSDDVGEYVDFKEE
ncbi:MAG: hypothetical protein IJ286_01045 [Alistipes sp.]|nr:hypothetical protein [Alistipes sp.]